jgi:catechol 2,3-dioxygenase-like lactoylglutathione lyase family enzyme
MQIDSIDHFVLTVQDVERAAAFYADVLGMAVVTSGTRTALHFGSQRINLHPTSGEIAPKANAPTPGAGDFCLLTGEPLASVVEHLAAHGVKIVGGPVPRIGAAGTLVSVYFWDPDGNLVEVSNVLDASYNADAVQ